MAGLIAGDDFHEFFKEEKPEAYATWARLREEEQAGEVVQLLAKSNAVKNYKALQALANNLKNDLKNMERASILEKLIKMSGTIRDEDAIKVVKISSAHMAALIEADREISNR